MEIRFPPLKPWQRDVYEQVSGQGGSGKIFVLKSARQRGKSLLSTVILLSYLLSNRCTCVVLSPTLSQSRRMFRQLNDWLDGSGAITSSNATLLEVTFANGSECLYKSAEQRESLRGFTVTKYGICIIDEGAYVRDDIYEIVYPIVDACKAPMLVISTPLFRAGEFYNLYERGMSGKYPLVNSFDWTDGYDMSDMLSPEKMEYYRQTMSRLKFQSEILGLFLDNESALFGDLSGIIGPYSLKPPKYCGVDWSAGNNNDYTVATFMDEDGNVTGIRSWKDFDATDLVEELADIIASNKTLERVIIEENSLGRVYGDMLKKQLRGRTKQGLIDLFVTTNESKRRIIEELVKAVQTDGIHIPNDKELIWELQHYSAERTPTGKLTYNGVGANDDYVLSLAFALEAKRKGVKKTLSIAFA